MFLKLFLVFLGGGIGSMVRYLTSLYMIRQLPEAWLLGTWSVNLTGSFLIGLLLGWTGLDSSAGDYYRLLWVTGFCGGFTTFSTFSYENLLLLQEGAIARFAVYAF